MGKFFWLMIGGALGAAAAYLLDDQRGEERRSRMRDQLTQASDQMRAQAETASQEMRPHLEQVRKLKDDMVSEVSRRSPGMAQAAQG